MLCASIVQELRHITSSRLCCDIADAMIALGGLRVCRVGFAEIPQFFFSMIRLEKDMNRKLGPMASEVITRSGHIYVNRPQQNN